MTCNGSAGVKVFCVPAACLDIRAGMEYNGTPKRMGSRPASEASGARVSIQDRVIPESDWGGGRLVEGSQG